MESSTIGPRPKKRKTPSLTAQQKTDLVRGAQAYLDRDTVRNHALTDFDIHILREGHHFKWYEKMGAHLVTKDGVPGVLFAVWAPNAERVSVIGDFNRWNDEAHPMRSRWDGSGIWETFIPHIGKSAPYKYCIYTRQGWRLEKADPFGLHSEQPPKSASVVWDLDYVWGDQDWVASRRDKNAHDKPMSVYEVHAGSWRRVPEEGGRPLSYRELAHQLVDYVKEMGYTHIELMPVMAHPFQGSWGYQVLGYFAPASYWGTPQDLMYLIDRAHQNGIAVILDWVPSHFPNDGHGLYEFDGTHLFEHEDQRKGYHPDWKSSIFNYGRVEVRSFLISSAMFWIEQYHADGLRVDGVASMLYLDYSRKEGEWIPNCFGGRENLEAIDFLKKMNEALYSEHPDIQMIAEESTAWTKVSKPVWDGGLGFGFKWNMGWMHDTLLYFSKDPIHRKYHHNDLTFGLLYAFTENFMLSFSHDEVVHGKGAMLSKMPGDDWQKFANLRLLFGYMFGQPGKKLNFMGGEFGQWSEWNYETSLDWHLLQWAPHQGLQKWMKDLNRMYQTEPALYEKDFSYEGFSWIDCSDWTSSVLSWVRMGSRWEDDMVVVCNFTPVLRENFRVGVPREGYWREVL
ncbi:MAG: 1,4-alpha-glucan branching protein GlgB, partial [Elusimicrobia bacterium]|nr:1,4-alpha-glucan branching protein GlgB [Elusimicrobiota bacterium]